MADEEATGYMRFQDSGTDLNKHAPGSKSKDARKGEVSMDMEMDDLQVSLEKEEGTLRRKQRNMVDHSLTVYSDPSAVRPTSSIEALRAKMLKFVDSMVMRGISVLFVVIDIILLIVNLSIYGVKNSDQEPTGYAVAAMFFSSYFMIELGLRIFARGSSFFRYWYEILDLVVIVVSFIMTVVVISKPNIADTARVVLVGRLFRILLLGRIINERYQMSRVSRHVVSQNKRRYMKDGFDLDLTYVTERVIAMGFPSSGKMGLYRNSAAEVVRFFETKHPGHYRVYNLCSEKGYDVGMFSGQVYRVKIDDHNVPLLHELIEFCEDVHRWMEAHPDNVIAVHCKGGKGRTGTVVCCWLMRSGMYQDADSCLAYFGERRTDLSKGHKYQGVQTPSQSRWVGYYDEYLHRLNRVLPTSYEYRVKTIKIYGINGIGAGDGQDLFLHIIADGTTTADFALYNPAVSSKVLADAGGDVLTVDIKHGAVPPIKGNVKFRFTCSTKIKMKGLYDKSLFFFWLHTGFVKDFRFHLTRDDIDNPHKPKTHGVFRDNFAVDLIFEEV
ncbi:phosphatidylinositol 3,4,5-trisphosphate 3-phosphatase TPTE2-like [Sycon ciliatum]|uniref:phosphatidylinositol 3,4,5-trisphosphate 3-phosphatase TPTE2-like n=1 Tax=Sycon ciliatum TaxID=27933 RepID=UPI0031F65F82